jgi:hypothetical protein
MIQSFVRRPITSELAAFAVTDAAAGGVLRHVANDSSTWVGLYRIIEAVEADMKVRDALVKAGWMTHGQLRNFKHTANSPCASGDSSRHGRETTAPPKSPMQLRDAQLLVASVVMQWLQRKFGNAI